jgi:two-component system, OmpR family, alkaline phosphatase synthesis response regulator PhoP
MNKVVLIIDDEPINRILYEEFLKNWGYTVITAENGLKGLKMAQKYLPDFIILDYMLPGLNGIEVYNQLKVIPKTMDIPIIVVSAHMDKGVIIERCKIPLEDVYQKPINHREIKERIDSQLMLA